MNIHQILISDVDEVESILPSAVETVKHYFSEANFEHSLWDNLSIRSFIAEHFDNDVLSAYDGLKPYAYKADLARYCILYVYGGWYVDLGIEFISTPPIVDGVDLFVVRDYNSGRPNSSMPWQLSNGIIYAAPKNTVFLSIIDRIVDNTKTSYYGFSPLSPTGPELFGNSLAVHGWQNPTSNVYLIGEFTQNLEGNRLHFTFDGHPFALYKDKNKRLELPGTNNYDSMWRNKDIYISD